MWDLIVSVPDHCLSFYLEIFWMHKCSPEMFTKATFHDIGKKEGIL